MVHIRFPFGIDCHKRFINHSLNGTHNPTSTPYIYMHTVYILATAGSGIRYDLEGVIFRALLPADLN